MSLFSEPDAGIDDEPLNPKNPLHLEELVKILLKSASTRNRRELKQLYRMLMTVPFFKNLCKKMPDDLRGAILRDLRYKFVAKNSTIVQTGDQENYFYFIMRGSIYYILPLTSNDKQKSVFAAQGIHTVAALATLAELKTQPNLQTEQSFHPAFSMETKINLEDLATHFSQFKLVKTRQDGDFHGENALQFTTSSLVTGVCREPCHLFTLSAASYHRIVKHFQRRTEQDNFDFLKSIPLIASWPNENIFRLIYNLNEVTLKRKQVLFDKGDPAEMIYFVRSGEIEVTKEANVKKSEEEAYFVKNNKTNNNPDADKEKLVEMNAIWRNQHNQAKKQTLKMALLGANQSIGEEEIFTNSEVRKSKAVVKTSTVELFSVTAAIFLDCYKNQVRKSEDRSSPDTFDTFGAKNRWRKKFETQIVETNQITETKTHQFKVATQNTEETNVPLEFAKKEDRFSGIYGSKHVRSTSMTEAAPAQKLKPIPLFDDSIYQFNGIVVNPLIRRRTKTPRVDYKFGSPRMKNSSPNTADLHNFDKTAETPKIKSNSKIRIQSALQRTKSSTSPFLFLQENHGKSPKVQSIDNSPISNSSPYSRSSMIRSSSIISIQNPKITSLQTHTGGFFETVKTIQLKDTLESRRTPDMMSARGSLSIIKSYKDDNIVDTLVSSRGDLQLMHKRSHPLATSSSQLTLGLNKLSLPIKAASSPKNSFRNPQAPPKIGFKSQVASIAGTPLNKKSSVQYGSYSQLGVKSLISTPSSPKEVKLFSSRPQFKGNFLKRKL